MLIVGDNTGNYAKALRCRHAAIDIAADAH